MYKLLLIAIVALFLTAGISHFLIVPFFLEIMPPWIPWQKAIVLISGALEIIFAMLLVFKSTRTFGAWSLIALLILVFPANIQMLINYLHTHHPHLWIAIVRLPFQPLLIWWAYSFIHPEKYYS